MSDSHNQLIKDIISDSFGYDIKNIDYFISALTHKSKSSKNNYERMEILGDSVLQLVITDMLFKKYKDSNEGRITVMRQNLVNKNNLRTIFKNLKIEKVVHEINPQIKESDLYSDILESLFGALYLDSSFNKVSIIINELFIDQLDDNLFSKDPKTNLQEFLQKNGMSLPLYSTHKSHKKSFKYLVKCKIPNTTISLHLDSNKVKPAEQELALSALKDLMKKIKVLLIGKSNVGKSSFINYITNNKSSLVSKKLHSTRLSTYHELKNKNFDIQFIDTPGVSLSDNNLLAQAMKTQAIKHITNSDIIILLTQPQKSYEYEFNLINDIKQANKEYLICVNKCDLDINGDFRINLEQKLNTKDYSVISLTQNLDIDIFIIKLLKQINNLIPTTSHINDSKNNLYIIQELIRETIINRTNKELPYESAVRIVDYNKQKNMDIIKAEIIVSKDNHKKIVIGKNGNMIKELGIKSREKIEGFLNKKVSLLLHVLVKANWKNNSDLLKDFGYID